jgi:hypothetical protein
MATKWKNSEAKRLLERDLLDGTIPLLSDDMGPKEVFRQREQFSLFDYKNFTRNLSNLRNQIIQKKARVDSDTIATQWKNSEAKHLLERDLLDGTIPLLSDDMGPKEVFQQREQFAEFDYKNFRSNLSNLRKQIIEKKERAISESAALARDRMIYPRATHNHRGEPRWDGSEAEWQLKKDMDDGKHKTMKPELLYRSREVFYLNYSLTVWRKHIEQEERSRKFLAYVKAKNKKKLAKLSKR